MLLLSLLLPPTPISLFFLHNLLPSPPLSSISNSMYGRLPQRSEVIRVLVLSVYSLIPAVPLSEMARAATGHLQVPLSLSKPEDYQEPLLLCMLWLSAHSSYKTQLQSRSFSWAGSNIKVSHAYQWGATQTGILGMEYWHHHSRGTKTGNWHRQSYLHVL